MNLISTQYIFEFAYFSKILSLCVLTWLAIWKDLENLSSDKEICKKYHITNDLFKFNFFSKRENIRLWITKCYPKFYKHILSFAGLRGNFVYHYWGCKLCLTPFNLAFYVFKATLELFHQSVMLLSTENQKFK